MLFTGTGKDWKTLQNLLYVKILIGKLENVTKNFQFLSKIFSAKNSVPYQSISVYQIDIFNATGQS